MNYRGGATHTRLNGDCIFGTVPRTCAAFHAPIVIDDSRFPVFYGKYLMRANDGAQTAPVALVDIQCQCDNIPQILHPKHESPFA